MNINVLKFKKGMVAVTLVSFLIGCGGGGSSDTSGGSSGAGSGNNVPTGTYTVNVVDDNILGAIVNAPECASFSEDGDAVYTLKECIGKPSSINIINGFVDTNDDGIQDNNETAQVAPLKLDVSQSGSSDNFTVTPLTTLAAQDSDLSALAKALGISENDLFEDNPANTAIQRAVNAMLISARKAGITKFDSFVQDLATQIKDSNTTGLNALNAVKTYMKNNIKSYNTKFGVVFGGFIDDTSALDLTSPTILSDVEKTHAVTAGNIVLGGFIYDTVIPNATVVLYYGSKDLAHTTSDANGRYFLEVNKDILDASKVYKLEAVSGDVKLISYVTTQELKENLTGRQVSSGNLEDLIVSNVTTAKAVLVQKINSGAENNATVMNEAKALVENLYPQDILTISGVIKDVVDNNKTLSTASDTLRLAQDIVEVNATTKELTTTLPSEVNQTAIDTQVANIQNDPLLSTQVDSTTVVSEGNLRAIMENHTLYEFDYHGEYQSFPLTYDTLEILPDGSGRNYEYKYDENSSKWIVSEDMSGKAGDILWSSNGTKLYVVAPEAIPKKITLMAKESVNILGNKVNIYHQQEEITGEPGDAYYTDFVENAEHSGVVNFTSMSDSDKNITINYEGGHSVTYHLDDNGTYYRSHDQNTHYKYRTVIKNEKTFIVFDDGETHDGGGAMIYLDFTNHKAYKRDYHNIGSKDSDIVYDSTALLNIWKNLPFMQKEQLRIMIEDAQNNTVHSATNTWWKVTQRVIYNYIKSLEGKEGLKKFLAEREMYEVTDQNSSSFRIETLDFGQNLDYISYEGTNDDGTSYNGSYTISDYTATTLTLEGNIVVTVKDITDNYILVNIDGTLRRIYYDKNKAETYINSL